MRASSAPARSHIPFRGFCRQCPCGETGKHSGLENRWLGGLVGSSPTTGTFFIHMAYSCAGCQVLLGYCRPQGTLDRNGGRRNVKAADETRHNRSEIWTVRHSWSAGWKYRTRTHDHQGRALSTDSEGRTGLRNERFDEEQSRKRKVSGRGEPSSGGSLLLIDRPQFKRSVRP